MYSINKKFEFEASHKLLLDYGSPCTNIHGHSYKVSMQIFANELNKHGMVIDFTKMKKVKDWVINNWDHTLILSEKDNDLKTYRDMVNMRVCGFPYDNVTAELMAGHICKLIEEQILPRMGGRVTKIVSEVWETTNNSATFEKTFETMV